MSWVTKSREFIKEVRAEYKKVSFPAREEVISTTIVVLIASIIMAVYLWLADIAILRVYELVLGIFN